MKISTLLFLLIAVSPPIAAQETTTATGLQISDIPVEITQRIPDDEIAQFLSARQRVLDQQDGSTVLSDPFEEIGVSKDVLSRVPSDDLFAFLIDRGFVEILDHEHIGSHDHGGAPAPEEMIKLLYTLIVLIVGLIVLGMVLQHFRKTKDQEIIITALENQQEIPLSILQAKSRRGYLVTAIVLLTFGIGIMVAGLSGVVPSMLGAIPVTVAIGYFLTSILERRSY